MKETSPGAHRSCVGNVDESPFHFKRGDQRRPIETGGNLSNNSGRQG